MVNKFLEVLLDDLLGIPPKRNIGFRIVLLWNTYPISISPYRMALYKLNEIKEQLKNLHYTSFIHPSISRGLLMYFSCKRRMGLFRYVWAIWTIE